VTLSGIDLTLLVIFWYNISMNPMIQKLMKHYFKIRSSFALKSRTTFDKIIAERVTELKYLYYKAHTQNNLHDYHNLIDMVGLKEFELIATIEEIIEEYQQLNAKQLVH
jgi:hypothetical protein